MFCDKKCVGCNEFIKIMKVNNLCILVLWEIDVILMFFIENKYGWVSEIEWWCMFFF